MASASYQINSFDRRSSGSRARPSPPRRLARALLFRVTLVQIHGLLLATTAIEPYVQKLHEHREGHGEVDVALGDVLIGFVPLKGDVTCSPLSAAASSGIYPRLVLCSSRLAWRRLPHSVPTSRDGSNGPPQVERYEKPLDY